MKNKRQQLGDQGEGLAVRHLEQRGYHILCQNYRTPLGEIDIIAREGEAIVFIEVKTRQNSRFGSPKYAVDRRKQVKMSKAALCYLKETRQTQVKARFDVVSIASVTGEFEIEVVQNAFDAAYG